MSIKKVFIIKEDRAVGAQTANSTFDELMRADPRAAEQFEKGCSEEGVDPNVYTFSRSEYNDASWIASLVVQSAPTPEFLAYIPSKKNWGDPGNFDESEYEEVFGPEELEKQDAWGQDMNDKLAFNIAKNKQGGYLS